MGDLTVEPAAPAWTFDELFAEQYVSMVYLATALVDDRAVAEEVVQDCLSVLWERYDTVDNPAGYLRTCPSTDAPGRSTPSPICSGPRLVEQS